MPADSRFDQSVVDDPLKQQLFERNQRPSVWLSNFEPPQVFEQADLAGSQLIFSQTGTPEDEVNLWQEVTARWQEQSPEEAEQYALEARTTVGAHDMTSRATTRMALGVVRASQGREEEAEALLREALDVLEPTDLHVIRIELLQALVDFLRSKARDEEVDVYDITNGERFTTYVIFGDTGQIQVNGAAANLVKVGDLIIIAGYAELAPDEIRQHRATIVHVDEKNRLKTVAATVVREP